MTLRTACASSAASSGAAGKYSVSDRPVPAEKGRLRFQKASLNLFRILSLTKFSGKTLNAAPCRRPDTSSLRQRPFCAKRTDLLRSFASLPVRLFPTESTWTEHSLFPAHCLSYRPVRMGTTDTDQNDRELSFKAQKHLSFGCLETQDNIILAHHGQRQKSPARGRARYINQLRRAWPNAQSWTRYAQSARRALNDGSFHALPP